MAILTNLSDVSRNWKGEGHVIHSPYDATMLQMNPNSIDLILTSPPHINAIDYPRAHKFSEWWLSPETDFCQRSQYIGLRGVSRNKELLVTANKLVPEILSSLDWLTVKKFRDQYNKLNRFIVDMASVLNGCQHVLKPNGKLILVLADNRVGDNLVPVVDIVKTLLAGSGFNQVDSYTREIKKTRRRYPFSFNGVMNEESVITAFAT